MLSSGRSPRRGRVDLDGTLLVVVTALLFSSALTRADDSQEIAVVQFPVGGSARLHCSHSTSLSHVLASGWWSASWRRVFDPHTHAEMTSTASSSVLFRNATGGNGDRSVGNEFSVSLRMSSTLVLRDVATTQADLYGCVFSDAAGKPLTTCLVMLLVQTEGESTGPSLVEQAHAVVALQQTAGGYSVPGRTDGAVTLQCWQLVTNDGERSERRAWASEGEALGVGRNRGMSFQTKARTYNLTVGTNPAQLRVAMLTTFARRPQQNFTCVSRHDESSNKQPLEVSSYSVSVGPNPQGRARVQEYSVPSVFVAANTSQQGPQLQQQTLARCYQAGPRSAAHNSLADTPTPVWYVDGVSTATLTRLPHWADMSRCARTGEWISLEVQHGRTGLSVELSCNLEHHTVADGQPHCDIPVTTDKNGNEVSLSEGTTAATGNGTDNGDDDEGGVHVESLQSDGIIAVVILGVALLISVTTVITIHKRRERNIIIRRIRQRHRYLPSMPSDANISTM